MFTQFIKDESGFTGAEKALITMVALGLILAVVKIIKGGAESGAGKAAERLQGQSIPDDPFAGGGAGAGAGGGK